MQDDASQAVKEAVRQGVRASRFKNIAVGLALALLAIAGYSYLFFVGFDNKESSSHVAVVKVDGPLADDKDASAKNVISSIREAMENPHAEGLIISINSPGGSPIQAERIYDEIRRQMTAHPTKKIIAVINELCASGGYYVASAAPEIVASSSSLVGSIGVTGSGFGFTSAMEKVGVERRVYASGEHKLFLDPFSPKNESESEFFKGVLGKVHQDFIAHVKDGRGDRLKWQENPGVFTGLIWAGSDALQIGLIDKIGTVDTVLINDFGLTKVVVYQPKKSPLAVMADMIGMTVSREIKAEFSSNNVSVSL